MGDSLLYDYSGWFGHYVNVESYMGLIMILAAKKTLRSIEESRAMCPDPVFLPQASVT